MSVILIWARYEAANDSNAMVRPPDDRGNGGRRGVVADMVTERTFVTARAAAELLGVPEAVVIHDVQEGMDGALPALNGGRSGDYWMVYAYEVGDERLAMHRARLQGMVAFAETIEREFVNGTGTGSPVGLISADRETGVTHD